MPTECNPELFDFTPVQGRAVVAGFDGGAITSDAGALLLGATDRAIGLTARFAECFIDRRRPEWVEHRVSTLVGQRVFGIALGYEDLLKRVSEAANARNPCSRGRAAAVAEQAGATVGKSCSAQLVSAAPTRAR